MSKTKHFKSKSGKYWTRHPKNAICIGNGWASAAEIGTIETSECNNPHGLWENLRVYWFGLPAKTKTYTVVVYSRTETTEGYNCLGDYSIRPTLLSVTVFDTREEAEALVEQITTAVG